MNFLDIAKTRYSVRKYTDKKVEAEKLHQILNAAHVAPTAANLQPVRLLVVQEEGLKKISKAANLHGAPSAILVCADHSKAWKRPFDGKKTTDIDASILTDHMMLESYGTWPGFCMDMFLQARHYRRRISTAGFS